MKNSSIPVVFVFLVCALQWLAIRDTEARGRATVTLGELVANGRTYGRGEQISLPAAASMRTGVRQVVEVETPSQTTIRLGRDSLVGVDRSNANLMRGSALVSSGRRLLGRRSENVVVGSARVACSGSVLIAAAGSMAKITCLEGHAVVRLRERRGQFLQLDPGGMVMIDAAANEMPLPVEIDLDRLRRTTGLLGAPFGKFKGERGLQRAIAKQQRALAKGKLLASTVTVSGSGGETSVGGSAPAGGQTDNASGGSSSSGSSSGGGASGGGGGTGSSGSVASTSTSLGSAAACA